MTQIIKNTDPKMIQTYNEYARMVKQPGMREVRLSKQIIKKMTSTLQCIKCENKLTITSPLNDTMVPKYFMAKGWYVNVRNEVICPQCNPKHKKKK